jgi:hypothetical protein
MKIKREENNTSIRAERTRIGQKEKEARSRDWERWARIKIETE